MVSMVGLSMDKVCTLLRFFWELERSKSQADALLNQLSRQWEHEFESPCQLLTVSAVVHDAANNEAERSLRGATQDRRTGRTSRTLRGAQRRTILMSVLASFSDTTCEPRISESMCSLECSFQPVVFPARSLHSSFTVTCRRPSVLEHDTAIR